MPNLSHIMPNPVVIPILWGHDYVANPSTAQLTEQMVSDIVTGPFMNGLAQYGVAPGTVSQAAIIDDQNPPQVLVYKDANNNLQDDITPQLIGWIDQGLLPAPSSNEDINQLYVIFPPPETVLQTYNGAQDPIGNGVQAWHNVGVTRPSPPPTYYWAIAKTNDLGVPASNPGFANAVGWKMAHEMVEQFVDRNGTFEEVADPCECLAHFTYRQWSVPLYWSEWDDNCIHGDNPVSLKQFLTAIGFNFSQNGLKALGTSTLNIGYIASQMQSRDSGQSKPSQCYGPATLTANPQSNELGYDVAYQGSGYPPGATIQVALAGLTGRNTSLAVSEATADAKGDIAGNFSFNCTSQNPSLNAVLQAQDPPSHYVIASAPVSFACTP